MTSAAAFSAVGNSKLLNPLNKHSSKRTLSLLHGYCRPFCILLCRCSAKAAVWKSTQRGQLSFTHHTAGSSLCPETPLGMSRSKNDPETDLSHAEVVEADQEPRGCSCSCQEAGVCSSGPSIAWHQVREEMHSELSEAQTFTKTLQLT